MSQSLKKPFGVTWCLAEISVWLRGILTLMYFLKETEALYPAGSPVGVLSFHFLVKPHLSSFPSVWKERLYKAPSFAALQIISQTHEAAEASPAYKHTSAPCASQPSAHSRGLHLLCTHQPLRTYSCCQRDLVMWSGAYFNDCQSSQPRSWENENRSPLSVLRLGPEMVLQGQIVVISAILLSERPLMALEKLNTPNPFALAPLDLPWVI